MLQSFWDSYMTEMLYYHLNHNPGSNYIPYHQSTPTIITITCTGFILLYVVFYTTTIIFIITTIVITTTFQERFQPTFKNNTQHLKVKCRQNECIDSLFDKITIFFNFQICVISSASISEK